MTFVFGFNPFMPMDGFFMPVCLVAPLLFGMAGTGSRIPEG